MLSHRLCHRPTPGTDEPVGDVDVVGHVFERCVLLEDGADGDVETPGQAGGDGIGKSGMTVIGGLTAALLRVISEVLLRGRSGIAKQPQEDEL